MVKILLAVTLASLVRRDGNSIQLSGNLNGGHEGNETKIQGHINDRVNINKVGFHLDGKESVTGQFTIKTSSSNNKKQIKIKSRNGKYGGIFILNVQGIPFIRAGTWNRDGDDFDGDSFRVALLRLAEVSALNETAKNDTNFIRLINRDWSDIRVEKTLVEGVTIVSFSTSVVVNSCNITLKGMISDQVVNATDRSQTSTITPLRFKYGIEIDNFHFTHNGDLQLIKSVRSRNAFLHRNNTVATNAGTYEWTGDVIVDGASVAVTSHQIEGAGLGGIISNSDNSGHEDEHEENDGGNENLYAFNLGRGASIYWDPSLNLESQSAQENTQSASHPLGLGMAMAFFIALMML